MFKKTWPNGVKSDSGVSIRRTDRFELEYKEHERTLVVEVEPGDGLAVYTSTIKQWKPPHDSETISQEDKHRIINNIKAAMDFAEWKYVLTEEYIEARAKRASLKKFRKVLKKVPGSEPEDYDRI